MWSEVHDLSVFDGTSTEHEMDVSKGFTLGYPPKGKPPEPARLRRIDRIHVSTKLIESVNKCDSTFVAKSDHKAVVASLEPPDVSREGVTRRFYCPTSFLAYEDIIHQLTAALSHVVGEGVEWWDAVLTLIKKVALEYHSENRPQTTEEQRLLHFVTTCSRVHVFEAALHFFREKGYAPSGPAQAYTLLVALCDKSNTEHSGSRILGELRPLLTGEHENERDRRNRIHKLMRELQTRKRL